MNQSCPQQAANTMRFACHVELDGADDVRIGIKPHVGGIWRWSDWHTADAAHEVDMVLYNFKPDVDHDYRIELASGSNTGNIPLPATPTLPANLGDLKFDFVNNGAHTKYVLFDTFDCIHDQHYLVALNTLATGPYIAWYQDITAETGGDKVTGWSFTDAHTILANIDHQYTYEWALDGSVVAPILDFTGDCNQAAGDNGECPHHDAYRASLSGDTFVVTAAQDTTILPTATADFNYWPCYNLDGFTSDGFQVYDSAMSYVEEHTLMADMGFDPVPAGGGGPFPVCAANGGYWFGQQFDPLVETIDWTHLNSVAVYPTPADDLVLLSLREWNHVMLYNRSTRTVMWALNGDGGDPSPVYSSFPITVAAGITGDNHFGGQHQASVQTGMLTFFDNRNQYTGNGSESRAIQIDLETPLDDPWSATIVRSWVMRRALTLDSVDCTAGQGGVQVLPGTDGQNALVTCGSAAIIEELDQSDGTYTTEPVLQVALDLIPTAGVYDTCLTGADSTARPGFYRAWPLVKLGEF